MEKLKIKNIFLFILIINLGKILTISLEAIKQNLYNRQIGLMEKKQYYKLVDPFLAKAYQNSKIIRYIINYDNEFSDAYAYIIMNYIVQNFRHIAYRDTYRLAECEDYLKQSIEQYKNIIDPTINTQEEFIKIVKIITQANNKYYKQINIKKRFLFWGMRIIRTTFRK